MLRKLCNACKPVNQVSMCQHSRGSFFKPLHAPAKQLSNTSWWELTGVVLPISNLKGSLPPNVVCFLLRVGGNRVYPSTL